MTGVELSEFMVGMSDQQKMQFLARYIEERKDLIMWLVSSIGWGILGFDRFYIGRIGWGILKQFAAGGLYIWWIIDLFHIQNLVRKYNRKRAGDIAQEIGYFT